jgi:uncharacterized protein with HEPN domain
MFKEVLPYLKHIEEECLYLSQKAPEVKDYDNFIKNEDLKRAFVRSLEIIGEATKNINVAYREAHTEIPWREMAAMRDKLIHGYFGVNYIIVWDVIRTRIPIVLVLISNLIIKEKT